MTDQPGMMETNSKKRILILTANPKATPKLRLDKEVREIKEGLQRSKYRDRFEIHSVWAVRHWDLRRALLDFKPHIVHFSGHGTKEGLMLEDEMGLAVTATKEALSSLFEIFSDTVECVILSACYSGPQADAISKHIDYVIGMKKDFDDKAAIEFAVGFYDALGGGESVENAFKLGRIAVQFEFPKQQDYLIPVLKKRKGNHKRTNDQAKKIEEKNDKNDNDKGQDNNNSQGKKDNPNDGSKGPYFSPVNAQKIGTVNQVAGNITYNNYRK
jgi:hypothetical protein